MGRYWVRIAGWRCDGVALTILLQPNIFALFFASLFLSIFYLSLRAHFNMNKVECCLPIVVCCLLAFDATMLCFAASLQSFGARTQSTHTREKKGQQYAKLSDGDGDGDENGDDHGIPPPHAKRNEKNERMYEANLCVCAVCVVPAATICVRCSVCLRFYFIVCVCAAVLYRVGTQGTLYTPYVSQSCSDRIYLVLLLSLSLLSLLPLPRRFPLFLFQLR